MRFVICDDDQLITSMVEAMVQELGHEVVGVGVATADSVLLVESARPDVVIVDLSLGFNTDFDIIQAANEVGATTVVFSQNADHAILGQYAIRPTVVYKPDLHDLERVVARLALDRERQVVSEDRRHRPVREAAGPIPTGISDAAAFYEALNEGAAGDGLVSLDLEGTSPTMDLADLAHRVSEVLRGTDRLLATPGAVRVFLPGAGDEGAASFLGRLHEREIDADGAGVHSVVIRDGELPADAFDRLRHGG
jgi:hypothetical protein